MYIYDLVTMHADSLTASKLTAMNSITITPYLKHITFYYFTCVRRVSFNGQGPAQLGNHSHTWYKTRTLAHMAFHILDSDFLSWKENMGVIGQLVLLQ